MYKNVFQKYIERKLSLEAVNEEFLTIQSENEENLPSQNPMRVACIQRKINPVNTINDYVYTMFSFAREARKNGAGYIIFPEYNFFDLFGAIPGFPMINNFLNTRAKQGKAEKDPDKNNFRLLYDLFDLFAKPSEEAILFIMKNLAKQFSLYIYTGSFIKKEDNQLYNAGALFNPKGELLFIQKKVHLTDFEADIGLARGDTFQVASLPLGNVAAPICMDATYFETFRLVRNKGAEMVIIPIANNEEYNQWKAMRGIWSRVQEAYVYGLKSSLTGWIGGMHFTGKAGIFAPVEMTVNKDGIVALAKEAEGNEIVYADLDIEKLHRTRKHAEYFGDVNPDFEMNSFVDAMNNASDEGKDLKIKRGRDGHEDFE